MAGNSTTTKYRYASKIVVGSPSDLVGISASTPAEKDQQKFVIFFN